MLMLALGVSGCAGAQDSRRSVDLAGQCKLSRYRYREAFHSHFINWTPDGRHLIFDDGKSIQMVDAGGTHVRRIIREATKEELLYGFYADLSPDGTQLVYSSCEFYTGSSEDEVLKYEIASLDLESGEKRRLTENRHFDHYPVWSPDGKRIAFISTASSDHPALYTMAADGSDVHRLAPSFGGVALAPPEWSPHGEQLAFVTKIGTSPRLYLYTVRADGSGLTRVAETSRVLKRDYTLAPAVPAWSPDGQYLAFIRGYEASAAIYMVRPDGTDLRQLWTWDRRKPDAPTPIISQVAWSPDGTELLFFAGAAHVIGVDGSDVRRVSPPTWAGLLAWSADGTRIAVYELGNFEVPQPYLTLEGYSNVSLIEIGAKMVLTVAQDGTDLRSLLDGGPRHDWITLRTPHSVDPPDVAACSAGLVVPEPQANPGLVRDCEALLRIRDKLFGTAHLPTKSWMVTVPLVSWYGITIGGNPPRVHKLVFQGLPMTGTLPPELGDLSELRQLFLSGVYRDQIHQRDANRLTGPIPAELGNLAKLEDLVLSNWYLSGPIPKELSRLANLRRLVLSDNFLSGTIPPELARLSNLETLHLEGNNLSGTIPPELGNLTQLRQLSLNDNRLIGSIPPELGNLTQLTKLWLHYNGLTGSIPPELGKLANLKELHLHDTRLNGSIPPELSGLRNLEDRRIWNTEIGGCISSELPEGWVWGTHLKRCNESKNKSS